MKNYDVIIAGYTCVDLFPDFSRLPPSKNITDILKPGKLIEIDGYSFEPGGVVPNVGLVLKKFGKNVFMNSLVGEDPMGDVLIKLFDNYDVSEGIKTTKKAGTGFSIVIALPGIDRIFFESTGCNELFDYSCINFDAVSQCKIFHFGYPPLLKQFYLNGGRQLVKVFSETRRLGAVTSLDFSLPDPASESGRIDWPELMQNVLPLTDIFVPSLEEALNIMMPNEYDKMLSEYEDGEIIDQIPEDVIRKLGSLIIDAGVKILMIKAGHRGLYLFTGNVSSINKGKGIYLPEEDWSYRRMWCKAYPADPSKIINASGAGDTAVAAFLTAILDGYAPESSLKYAAMAGRNSLFHSYIYEDLSDWQTLTKEIRSTTNKIVPLLNEKSKIDL